jgi:hypothetical protein
MVAVNGHHRRQRFACRQAPTGEKPRLVFVFVGASLLANGGGERASPQAKIRLHASSYKGKRQVFVFVGASDMSMCPKRVFVHQMTQNFSKSAVEVGIFNSIQ